MSGDLSLMERHAKAALGGRHLCDLVGMVIIVSTSAKSGVLRNPVPLAERSR